MWMEPKARAVGAPQRYTNVTAMKHASNAHDYPRSRTFNGFGNQQTRIGALYFPKLYHGGHWPPRTACGANFAYECMQEGSNPAQSFNESGYKLSILAARGLHPFGVSCYQSCLSGRLIGLTITSISNIPSERKLKAYRGGSGLLAFSKVGRTVNHH